MPTSESTLLKPKKFAPATTGGASTITPVARWGWTIETREADSSSGTDGKRLSDPVCTLEREVVFFGTVLTTKSSQLDPTISALFPQRPLAPLLGDELTMDGLMMAIRGMPN